MVSGPHDAVVKIEPRTKTTNLMDPQHFFLNPPIDSSRVFLEMMPSPTVATQCPNKKADQRMILIQTLQIYFL